MLCIRWKVKVTENACRGKGRDSVPQELWKRNTLLREGYHGRYS